MTSRITLLEERIFMWQSWVNYSIAYFDYVAVFKVLKHKNSSEGGVHMWCIDM